MAGAAAGNESGRKKAWLPFNTFKISSSLIFFESSSVLMRTLMSAGSVPVPDFCVASTKEAIVQPSLSIAVTLHGFVNDVVLAQADAANPLTMTLFWLILTASESAGIGPPDFPAAWAKADWKNPSKVACSPS